MRVFCPVVVFDMCANKIHCLKVMSKLIHKDDETRISPITHLKLKVQSCLSGHVYTIYTIHQCPLQEILLSQFGRWVKTDASAPKL
jgi:hypothetical protein